MNAASAGPFPARQQLADLLAPVRQQHLLIFWDELDDPQRIELVSDITRIDLDLIAQLFRTAGNTEDWSQLARSAQPPTAVRLHSSANSQSLDAHRAGDDSLRRGEVGAILVAGGEGSRLGFERPKGTYPVGPVSGATLFQILFEKVVAVSRRFGAPVPLYIMTSDATHEPTGQFLAQHDFFGLPRDQVQLFRQGVMPAVDAASGQILLAGKSRLALSPDGHGGLLDALVKSGALADIQRRGLKHLFYFQVDNPLVEICDAPLIGRHVLARSEMTTLAVAKRDAADRMGNIVQIDGRTRIIEYSDLPDDVAHKHNPDGSLRLWAGNTAVHVFDVDFLARTAGNSAALPYHVARKVVPHVDEYGNAVTPIKPNAVKFERFIFDLLPLADHALVVEADRASSFAPVKNAAGQPHDTLATSQAAMIALHRRWLEAAGAQVAPGVAVEISPLLALDEVELRGKIQPGTRIDSPTYLH